MVRSLPKYYSLGRYILISSVRAASCGCRTIHWVTAQIPIAEHAARRGRATAPKSRFPPLEVFVRRPPELAASSDAAGIRKPSQLLTHAPQQTACRGRDASRLAAPRTPAPRRARLRL